MPLAVTEWGWPAWKEPKPEKGFVTFRDAQLFLLKSSFYFLAMERVELLIQFELGIGPEARDKDPLFFMLVNRDSEGKIIFQPTFATFRWLASTFGSKPYRAVPLASLPGDKVKGYAIRLSDSGDIYVAVWQDGVPDVDGKISDAPAREVEINLGALDGGDYAIQALDIDGKESAAPEAIVVRNEGLKRRVVLPAISSTSESELHLLRIVRRNGLEK